MAGIRNGAIRQVEGYIGTTRDFLSPISESTFGSDVLKFHDKAGRENGFSMNLVKGSPVYSTDVCSRDFVDGMWTIQENFGLVHMTSSTSEYQEFHPTHLGDKRKIKSGTLKVRVNGYDLRTMSGSTDQSNTNKVEAYLDSTYKKVRIKKLYIEDINKIAGDRVLLGIDLNDEDTISLKYQQETS